MIDKVKSKKKSARKSSKNEKSTDVTVTTQANIAVTANSATPLLVPVTAIGASAGGLEPIEQFFDAMPVDSGSAFVIIQHLSPDHLSLMDELLARHSSMKIKKIVNGLEIEPNSIYLNTPRSVITVDGNHIRAKDANPQQKSYLPIDIFFESLAANRGADSIAIVLSGTGSDGAKGGMVITESGGKVLVQDPETARFESMPRSVLDHGMSILSASPAVLANCVTKLLKNERIDDIVPKKRLSVSDPLADVLSMLKHSHGTDFLQYKDTTVNRRIERRAQMRHIEDINVYRDLLANDNDELKALYDDLLIEVTEFFRDQAAFEALENTVIPKLFENMRGGAGIRVWVPGCASGEEAYSIAILLQEHAREIGKIVPIKIIATDIHARSMSKASSGIYNESALKNLPEDIVDRYFDRSQGQAQIKLQLRNMVLFSTQDVIRDAPFTRIDLISCRNLLIYLKENAQESVLKMLHFSLQKDGFLFLGPSEHIGAISHEFEKINEKWRIYKKLRDIKLISGESVFRRYNSNNNIAIKNAPFVQNKTIPSGDSIQFKQAHQDALENIVSEYAPPGFLLSEDGAVVHIFGSAGDLIPMQTGAFSRRLVDLIKPELKVVVSAALEHGRYRDFSGFRRTAYVRSDTEASASYEIKLTKVGLPGQTLQFQLLTVKQIKRINDEAQQSPVVAQDKLLANKSAEELRQLNRELELNLQSSEENLQSTIEELETSNEELQSTNEELMSTNEELQSTNEELHSVNEELYTVSAENQRKIDDLTEKDADIDLLLHESMIGTIHLDDQLRLRRYSETTRSVFNILPADIGRPIHLLASRLSGDYGLLEMAERVNAGLEAIETKMVLGETVFLVRVIPYRPRVSEPSGVVIAIIDITDVENVNAELSSLNAQYSKLAEKTNMALMRWDAKSSLITHCNERYAMLRGFSVEDLIGQNRWDFFSDNEQREKLRQALCEIEPDGVGSVVVERVDPHGRTIKTNVSIHAISQDGINIREYQSMGQDITEEVNYKKALEDLISLLTDDELSFETKIDDMLIIGVDYLGMESAVVGMVTGDCYQIKHVKGELESKLRVGDEVPVKETFSVKYLETQACFAIESVSESELAGTVPHSKFDLESYIGAAVYTSRKSYGTVYFASSDRVDRPFTSQNESFTMLISSWIGYLVKSQE